MHRVVPFRLTGQAAQKGFVGQTWAMLGACAGRWVPHLQLNAVNDGDIVFMHQQSANNRAAGRNPNFTAHYFTPGDSDRCCLQLFALLGSPCHLPKGLAHATLCTDHTCLHTPVLSHLKSLRSSH